MYGSNTEKVIKLIDRIIERTANIHVEPVLYRIKTKLDPNSPAIINSTAVSGGESHSHGAGSLELANPIATEIDHADVICNISDLQPLKSEYDNIISKIHLIDDNIYVKNVQMHNSIGSPYTELYRLQKCINDVLAFSFSCTIMGEYVYAIAKAVTLLNRTLQMAVDAKWAVIEYADYLERGYNYILGQDPETTK